MLTVIQFFFAMCLFRIGPDKAPERGPLVPMIIAANVILQHLILLSNRNLDVPAMLALGWVVLFTATFAGCIWTLLKLKEKTHRFSATFSSLQGCSLVLSLLLLLLLIAQLAVPEPDAALSAFSDLPNLLAFALQIWILAVSTFILKAGMDVNVFTALAAIIFATIFSAFIAVLILPPPPGLLSALPKAA